MKEILQPVTILLLIIPIIFAVIYVLKKMINKASTPCSAINIINQISIGAKERVLHIEINGTSMLIGATPQQISTLHVFDASPNQNTPARPLKPSISSVLNA